MSLINFRNFKKDCLKFGEPVKDKHGGIRINLTYNDDSFYLQTPTLFSFGVQESIFNNEKIGYQIPLCLHSKNGATLDQKIFIRCLQDIQTECHKYLKQNFSADVSNDLSKIIYMKNSHSPPMLFLKLDWHMKKDEILTLLTTHDEEESISLQAWMQNYCKVIAAISFRSIYISQKSVSIQLKAEEIYFKPSPKKERKPMIVVEESESGEESSSEEERVSEMEIKKKIIS